MNFKIDMNTIIYWVGLISQDEVADLFSFYY